MRISDYELIKSYDKYIPKNAEEVLTAAQLMSCTKFTVSLGGHLIYFFTRDLKERFHWVLPMNILSTTVHERVWDSDIWRQYSVRELGTHAPIIRQASYHLFSPSQRVAGLLSVE